MRTALYFAYGSNLDMAQMRQRCPSSVAGQRATLPRHRLVFRGHSKRWGGGVASIVRDDKATVTGRLYSLPPTELERLDRFEGCPASYVRVARIVELANGRRLRAQVYVAVDTMPVNPPSRRYFAVLDRAYVRLKLDRMSLANATLAALRASASQPRHVFVYGTLRQGEANHRLLRSARFVRRARSAPYFRLVDLGGFPAMVSDGSMRVVGELYLVDSATLAALDRLEGHPTFYERAVIVLEDGARAYAYLLRPEQVDDRPPIPSGDWRRRRRRAS